MDTNRRTTSIIGAVTVALLLLVLLFKIATGLRVVQDSEPCTAPDCFESIIQYKSLYDGRTKVSRVDEIGISPSGTYAAFDNGDKILLYKRGSGQVKDVTDGIAAIPETFTWNESQEKLVITYYQDNPNSLYAKHPPSTIHLE